MILKRSPFPQQVMIVTRKPVVCERIFGIASHRVFEKPDGLSGSHRPRTRTAPQSS